MKDLHNYTSALRDVGLDSTPVRIENGEYRWSNGQLEILNQPEFNGIRVNQLKISQTEDSVRDISGEILAYETPIRALEKEGEKLLEKDQDAINDQQIQIDHYKSLLNQLDRDMLIRGYIPPEESEQENLPPPEPPKNKKLSKVSLREIMGFLAIWVVGEVFMTYVQWNTLRDGKGIEDMIVRSISLGVVLFLIHLVGRMFKRDRRPVQLVFLVFSFIMLFIMLLAPLYLKEAYPLINETVQTTDQWALDSSAVPEVTDIADPYPFWVTFYRNNDMLPGIFVFLFFVIMQTFGRKPQKQAVADEVMPDKPVLPEFRPSEGKNQIEERRQYYQQQIAQGEQRLRKLSRRQSDAVAPNTERLQEILGELTTRQEKMISLKRQKDDLFARNDQLLRNLEMQLNRYRTEFMNVLKNDHVKAMVVQPEWPGRHDLMDYFNLY